MVKTQGSEPGVWGREPGNGIVLPLDGELLVSFKALARGLPGNVSYDTLRRWAKTGFNGVYLEQRRIGGRFFSSVEAVRRFMAKTQEI